MGSSSRRYNGKLLVDEAIRGRREHHSLLGKCRVSGLQLARLPWTCELTLCHHLPQMLLDAVSARFGSSRSVPSYHFFLFPHWNEDVSHCMLEVFHLLFSGAQG